jgi:hypothetical protein
MIEAMDIFRTPPPSQGSRAIPASDASRDDTRPARNSSSVFTKGELEYLLGERRLARIATVGVEGTPHVVPTGWSYNALAACRSRQRRSVPRTSFVGHGKKKGPLDKLCKLLDQFRIPYKVAEGEPNLGRPIPAKVK